MVSSHRMGPKLEMPLCLSGGAINFLSSLFFPICSWFFFLNLKIMNVLKVSKTESLSRAVAGMDFNTLNGEPYLKRKVNYTGYLLTVILLLLWPFAQGMVTNGDERIGVIDPNIWMLMMLSVIYFMVVTALCWWVLQRFWLSLGLPGLGIMVLQFKALESWQQLSFYWASFALLLLTMQGVLTAIL